MRLLVCEVFFDVHLRRLGMLLLKHSSLWVFVSEDEMKFIIFATFIWTKHDGVRCLIIKVFLQREREKCIDIEKGIIRVFKNFSVLPTWIASPNKPQLGPHKWPKEVRV